MKVYLLGGVGGAPHMFLLKSSWLRRLIQHGLAQLRFAQIGIALIFTTSLCDPGSLIYVLVIDQRDQTVYLNMDIEYYIDITVY